jgi:hypothetical protein
VNAAYRQKLLNWFCSMGLVLLAMIVSVTHGWFFELPDRVFSRDTFDIVDIVIVFGEPLILYPFFAAPLMIWHFFDFVEQAPPKSSWGKKATQYKAFFGVMTVNLALFVLMEIGLWKYNSCDDFKGVYFSSCYSGPSSWLEIPWFATLGVALLLCIVKAGFSIRSFFEKS